MIDISFSKFIEGVEKTPTDYRPIGAFAPNLPDIGLVNETNKDAIKKAWEERTVNSYIFLDEQDSLWLMQFPYELHTQALRIRYSDILMDAKKKQMKAAGDKADLLEDLSSPEGFAVWEESLKSLKNHTYNVVLAGKGKGNPRIDFGAIKTNAMMLIDKLERPVNKKLIKKLQNNFVSNNHREQAIKEYNEQPKNGTCGFNLYHDPEDPKITSPDEKHKQQACKSFLTMSQNGASEIMSLYRKYASLGCLGSSRELSGMKIDPQYKSVPKAKGAAYSVVNGEVYVNRNKEEIQAVMTLDQIKGLKNKGHFENIEFRTVVKRATRATKRKVEVPYLKNDPEQREFWPRLIYNGASVSSTQIKKVNENYKHITDTLKKNPKLTHGKLSPEEIGELGLSESVKDHKNDISALVSDSLDPTESKFTQIIRPAGVTIGKGSGSINTIGAQNNLGQSPHRSGVDPLDPNGVVKTLIVSLLFGLDATNSEGSVIKKSEVERIFDRSLDKQDKFIRPWAESNKDLIVNLAKDHMVMHTGSLPEVEEFTDSLIKKLLDKGYIVDKSFVNQPDFIKVANDAINEEKNKEKDKKDEDDYVKDYKNLDYLKKQAGITLRRFALSWINSQLQRDIAGIGTRQQRDKAKELGLNPNAIVLQNKRGGARAKEDSSTLGRTRHDIANLYQDYKQRHPEAPPLDNRFEPDRILSAWTDAIFDLYKKYKKDGKDEAELKKELRTKTKYDEAMEIFKKILGEDAAADYQVLTKNDNNEETYFNLIDSFFSKDDEKEDLGAPNEKMVYHDEKNKGQRENKARSDSQDYDKQIDTFNNISDTNKKIQQIVQMQADEKNRFSSLMTYVQSNLSDPGPAELMEFIKKHQTKIGAALQGTDDWTKAPLSNPQQQQQQQQPQPQQPQQKQPQQKQSAADFFAQNPDMADGDDTAWNFAQMPDDDDNDDYRKPLDDEENTFDHFHGHEVALSSKDDLISILSESNGERIFETIKEQLALRKDVCEIIASVELKKQRINQ